MSRKGQTHLDLKTGTVILRAPRVVTEEDAVKKAKLDLNKWRIERAVYNSWEVGAKMPDGTIAVEPLWQVKLWVVPRTCWDAEDFRRRLIGDVKHAAPKRPRIGRPYVQEKMLYEVSIFDAHIGKLCWTPETGNRYNLEIAQECFQTAVDDLISKVQPVALSKIVFPVGNDFLHVDSKTNMTTNGTPQDVDGRWQQAFIYARRIICDAVDRLRKLAPVDIVVVPGNHDQQRSFYLGEVLDAFYSKDPEVRVDNSPKRRKYYEFGVNLLGFTHGDEEPHESLPNLMADEVPDWWASCPFREWHVGHLHKKKSCNFMKTEDTYGSTLVRVLPSLSALDAWHASKGYRSPRSSEAYLYSAVSGPVASYRHNVRNPNG